MGSVSYRSSSNDTIKEIVLALFNKMTNLTITTFSIRAMAIASYGTFSSEFPLYSYAANKVNEYTYSFFSLNNNYSSSQITITTMILYYDATVDVVRLSRNTVDATSEKPGIRECSLLYLVLR